MKKLQVWLPLLFAIVMIVGMLIGFRLRGNIRPTGFFLTRKQTPVEEVMDLINLQYVDSVSTDTLGNDAIEGMLTHLDPHSVFIPATDLSEVNEDLQGNFEGIGGCGLFLWHGLYQYRQPADCPKGYPSGFSGSQGTCDPRPYGGSHCVMRIHQRNRV